MFRGEGDSVFRGKRQGPTRAVERDRNLHSLSAATLGGLGPGIPGQNNRLKGVSKKWRLAFGDIHCWEFGRQFNIGPVLRGSSGKGFGVGSTKPGGREDANELQKNTPA